MENILLGKYTWRAGTIVCDGGLKSVRKPSCVEEWALFYQLAQDLDDDYSHTLDDHNKTQRSAREEICCKCRFCIKDS